MPKVILYYNISPECVLCHHGVMPRLRGERVRLMRPLADEVAGELRSAHRGWTFEAKAKEWDDPTHLLVMEPPSGAFSRREADSIGRVVTAANSDITRLIDGHPSVLTALCEQDLATYRRLTRMSVTDVMTIVRVLDEFLTVVDGLESLTRMDVMAWVHPSFEYPGRARLFPSADGLSGIGYRIKLRPPTSAGVIAHESAHVLGGLRECARVERHDDSFACDLGELLAAVLRSGCEDSVMSILSEVESPNLPTVEGQPEIVDGGRWRLFRESSAGYATWRPDGAAGWGVGTVDNDLYLSYLLESQRAFALLTVGRHPSQVGEGVTDGCQS